MKRSMIISVLLIALSISCTTTESDPITVDQSFSYTAVGDDGIVGQADKIQIRMALTQDSLVSQWDACAIIADTVSWAPTVNDTLTVQITVETGIPYYFAIKTADEVPNWSLISNIVSIAYADVTSPSPISDLTGLN